jgi:hypothetical protein
MVYGEIWRRGEFRRRHGELHGFRRFPDGLDDGYSEAPAREAQATL